MAEEQQNVRDEKDKSAPPKRAWSLYLLTAAGIPIYLHFTLILLLLFIGFYEITAHQKIFGGLLAVVLIFASITLHELGHALMARRYKIKTEDIVLYPIGGVARLHSMGKGLQELWIALAGPSVNIVIAAVLFTVLKLTGTMAGLEQLKKGEIPVLQTVMIVNIILVVFNLLPAFPMDGGRVLRALLSTRMKLGQATEVAAKVGQGMAVLFMIGGLMSQNFMLMFIGLFVFLAAGQEQMAVRSQVLVAGHRVRDAMITHFDTISHGDTLGVAADLLLATSQQDFPVVCGEQVVGLLGRQELIQGLAAHGRDHYVAQVMAREFQRLSPSDPLERTLEILRGNPATSAVLVFEGERLAGYVNNENLIEYFMIAQASNHTA